MNNVLRFPGEGQPNMTPTFTFTTILVRTPSGEAEVQNTRSMLHHRVRRALLLADGEMNAMQIVTAFSRQEEGLQAIQELLDRGFIAPAGTGSASRGGRTPLDMTQPITPISRETAAAILPPTPQPAYEPPPPQFTPQPSRANDTGDVLRVKAEIMSYLRTKMGADAELVAPRIAACQSKDDLLAACLRLRDVLERYSNATVAREFVDSFKNKLL
jgi:hypothetical protein